MELVDIMELLAQLNKINQLYYDNILSLYEDFIHLNQKYKNLADEHENMIDEYKKALKECAGLRKALDNTYN